MKSQQKCIMIFALVCCFAVLVALIFSAVDIWGEDEDGITEENCSRTCRVVLVENIPEDVSFPPSGPTYLPLTAGLHDLLDRAMRSLEIVSPVWLLNSSDYEASSQRASLQGRALLTRLQGLKARGVQLKISSEDTDSTELSMLARLGADIHYLNTTALIRGQLHASFWVVDRKHLYFGSATMNWRSLATRKELGVLVYDCSCLALDLHKVFSLYWGLQYKDFIPSFWSKRVFALYNRDSPLELTLNSTKAQAYISTSPSLLIPRDRSSDLEAISRVIQEAHSFLYISITDYLPLLKSGAHRYWSRIDGLIRDALILRRVRVHMLVSCWEHTNPLTFNFIWSLRSLCMEQSNCSLEARFFSPREQRDGSLQRINHNRFMVTDSAVYLGNLDWVGNEFTFNAGAGLVISQQEGVDQRNSTVVEQLRDAFERDWSSRYTHSLQPDLLPVCNRHKASRLVPLKGARPPHSSTVPLAGSPPRHLPAPIQTPSCNSEFHHSNKQEPSRGSRGPPDNGLASTTAGPMEEGRATLTQPEDRQVYVKVSHSDSPMGSLLPSQPIESSGGRELQSGPLWPPGTDV
ncbi:inactive phospholipase D5 [Gadus macrocephalus]|uniref:inactive phospholipase D5 n=1 Tax=Gadus macrocephalus TaxID=80720 RepID=UPI0028CB3FEC|nr:inactive phospholipase D5 [Gadus macrocephalus]